MVAASSRQGVPPMITATAAASRMVDFEADNAAKALSSNRIEAPPTGDVDLSFGERAFSAAGAAVISAVIVNPLDVAKTRLQAQAAGVPYQGSCESGTACSPGANTFIRDTNGVLPRSSAGSETACTSDCGRYRGTKDVFYKVIRQEGFGRLWRGTNASLALAVPTVGIYMPCYDIFRNSMEEFTAQNFPALTPYVPLLAGSASRSLACIACYPVELARTRMQTFTEAHNGMKPPGVWKTLAEVVSPVKSSNNVPNATSYRILWTGLGAQLARDVPFSAICWSTLEPIRRRVLSVMVDDPGFGSILGANFSAGVVAGSLAAAATCPLDVAKTRRQIEMDRTRALKMTTRQTLMEIWRDGGMKGLFTGVGPRVGRAGPSVGIVVSFYEVVKHSLQRTRHHQLTDRE